MKDIDLANEIVIKLNDLLKSSDSKELNTFLFTRIKVPESLSKQFSIFVDDNNKISIFGFINGLIGTIKNDNKHNGYGYIAACFDDTQCENLIKFNKYNLDTNNYF